jgi:hypothetical protein
MVRSSTTSPSYNGLIGTELQQSSAFPRLVLTLKVAASQTIAVGDLVAIDSDGNVIKNVTNAAQIAGVAENAVTTSASEVGTKTVSVLVSGITDLDCLVQDTDGSAGYDAPINVGQTVFVGGDAGTTVADGQAVVAGNGTVPITTFPIGRALDKENGSTAGATTSRIRVLLNTAASFA